MYICISRSYNNQRNVVWKKMKAVLTKETTDYIRHLQM
jgi:hypothetical protein